MPAYIPPYLRTPQSTGGARGPPPPPPRRSQVPSARPTPTSQSGVNDKNDTSNNNGSNSTPLWRRGATATSRPGPIGRGTTRTGYMSRLPSGPGLSIPASIASNLASAAAPSSTDPPGQTQATAETSAYATYSDFRQSHQPTPIPSTSCLPSLEYAQWAGGFVLIDDTLLSQICPCNLVGTPCPFDELEGSCPMIRLCGQLEKWTQHKCPDRGFRTIVDEEGNVPGDYTERGYGGRGFWGAEGEGSDNGDESEAGGVALDTDAGTNIPTATKPTTRHKKLISFNDFSTGITNACGHIHWEVEINCRFVGWSHFKKIPCKQVLEKGRLCSVGHDFETARQRARDAVVAHERVARRAGAVVGGLGERDEEGRGRWIY